MDSKRRTVVAVVLLMIAVAAIAWATLGSLDPTKPTARIHAGDTPVYRGSGEPLKGHELYLPPLPKK